MKNLTKILLMTLSIILVATNAYIFINSIKLSDKINQYEKDINKLHRENLSLENKIYDIDSLKFASSMSAQLNFTQKAQPVYLDNLQYARN